MYDVTAIDADRNFIPLAADASLADASLIARNAARLPHWACVQVRGAGTGSVVATYGTMPPDYYVLAPGDVGRLVIPMFGRQISVASTMGRILPADVGKRVYLRGQILQMENDKQRAERERGTS